MCASQKPQESDPQYRGANGSAGGSVLLLPLTSPSTGMAFTGEFHKLREKEVGRISQRGNSHPSIARIMINKDLDQSELNRSKLRDPGLEAAVDRIITGIEKILPGLSESQNDQCVSMTLDHLMIDLRRGSWVSLHD
jgi:hypothetical protein